MISPTTLRLTAIPFDAEITKLTERFTGREWVFEEINNWLKHQDERFFVLTGKPGMGKSAIAARLAQTHQNIAAYHFCIAGESGTIQPNGVLLSLAAQLVEYFPEYAETLANIVKPLTLSVKAEINAQTIKDSVVRGVVIENLYTQSPQETLDLVLRRSLANLPNPPEESVLILIDSLDEAVTYGDRENLVTLLSGVGDLPTWLRLIVTTRPDEQRVLSYLKTLKPYFYHLDELSQKSLKDVHNYVGERVAGAAIQVRLLSAQTEAQSLVERITDLSKGNFLYTKVLLDDIESGGQPLDDLDALPKSLDESYHRFLRRLRSEWETKYQIIFGILTVTKTTVTNKELINFIANNPAIERAPSETQLNQALGVVKQFLDVVPNNDGQSTYRLFHTSLRDYLLDQERNPVFWCSPKDGHRWIVEYCWQYHPNDWRECDRYGLRYFAAHLVELAFLEKRPNQSKIYIERLHELLATEVDRHNAWFVAKDNIGDTSGFLSDVKLAWEQTEKAFERQSMRVIELQCRYALIISSVNSLASSIPSVLLEALVKQKVWSFSKAISYVRQAPDRKHRVESLARLLPYLQEPDREQCFKEGLAAVQSIATEIERLEPLQVLITYLPDPKPKPLLEAVLQQIWKFNDRKLRMEALAEVAPDLNQDLATEAYSIVVDDDDSDIEFDGERMWRVIAMFKLYPNLSEYHRQQAVELIKASVSKIENSIIAQDFVLELMMNLDGLRAESSQLLTTARESLRSSDDSKTEAILKLISYLSDEESLSDEERIEFLDEILQSLIDLSLDRQRELLSQIAALVVPLSLQTELLSAVKKYWGSDEHLLRRKDDLLSLIEEYNGSDGVDSFISYNYVFILVKLTPYMPRELQSAIVQESIDLADNILSKLHDNEFSKGKFLNALAELTPYMKPSQVSWVHSEIRRIRSAKWRLQSLSSLVSSLPKEECEILIRELLALTQTLKHDPYFKNQLKITWENIVPFFSTSLLQEALVASQAINDVRERIRNLSYFVPYLSENQKLVAFRWILSLASGDDEEWWRASLLSESAPHFPNCFWDEALTIARALTEPVCRAKALTALASISSNSQKQQMFVEVKAAIEQIDDIFNKCQAWVDLLPALALHDKKVLITNILNETKKLENMKLQASILVQLLPFLSKSKRTALLKSAVSLIKFSRHEEQALKILAPHLPVKLVREILENMWYRFSSFDESIPALLARLTELGQPHVALRYIHHIELHQTRNEALLSVAPHLSLSSIREAWHEVLGLEDKYKDSVLEALCLRLIKLNQVKLAQSALLWQISKNSQARVNALLEMSPYLDVNEQVTMLQEVLSIINKNNSVQWTNLASRLAQCSPAVLANFLEKALPLLSATNRQQLIPSLYSLAPIIIALGTKETLIKIFSDIENVVRWWP
jgi:hypothetical protein